MAGETTNLRKGYVTFRDRQLKLNTAEDAEIFAKTLELVADLTTLEMRGNTIGIEASKRIAKAFAGHPEMEHCLWSDIFTGRLKNEIPPILRCLTASMMQAGCHITTLDLSDNAFGPIGAEGIQEFLVSPSAFSLETLKLNNNGLGAGGKIIAKCLEQCHANAKASGKAFKLKTFIAGRNRLENPGAIALAAAFKAIGTLEYISIPQNGIRPEGFIQLAESFKANPNLKTIVLNDNCIDTKGGNSLAQALTLLVNVETIDFGDCLCRAGCAKIIGALCGGNHRKIKTVDLSGSEMGYYEAEEIITSWKTYFKQTNAELKLGSNMFGSRFEELEELVEELNVNVDLGDIDDDEGSAEEKYSDEDSDGDDIDDISSKLGHAEIDGAGR